MHENHRKRLRERFLAEGLDGFAPHQALELLLCYGIPRQDTNPLAHRLLDTFGSLQAVLDAHPDDLMAVPGIGQNAAVLLALLHPLWRMTGQQAQTDSPVLDNQNDACRYAMSLFVGRGNEALILLCLDQNCRLTRHRLMQEGTVDEVTVHPRTIVEEAIRSGASQVILTHNHPKGSPSPSPNDIAYTRKLAHALHFIGVVLVDHIIVGETEVRSMAAEGILDGMLRQAGEPLQAVRRAYRVNGGESKSE